MMQKRIALSLLAVAALMAGCHKPVKDMNGKRVHFAGSYAKTCRKVTDLDGGRVTAECEDAHGQFHPASVQASACTGDLANMNGVLTCPGAVAAYPPITAEAPASSAPPK